MKFSRFMPSAWVFILLFFVVLSPQAQVSGGIEKPETHFGFRPGTDRMLFDYRELISYLQKLDAASPRLKLLEVGKSPMGREMYIAFISSEENLNNLDKLKQINRRLALDPDIPQAERQSMLAEGKVFVLVTLSLHAGEVGPSQSAPLVAYYLVSPDDPQVIECMGNVVGCIIYCLEGAMIPLVKTSPTTKLLVARKR